MNSSAFVQTFASRGAAAWERAALEAARGNDGVVDWPLVPVRIQDDQGRELVVFVSSDYFAVGDSAEDAMRLPLTPLAAQHVADVHGMLLPTSKIARAIYAASKRLAPEPMQPNKGADLAQYADHDAKVKAQMVARGIEPGELVSGHKKDVLIGVPRPGKVIIYGWPRDGAQIPADDPKATFAIDAPWRIQPFSTVHGDSYVDYSHGIRFVSPHARLDGNDVLLADVLRDPNTAHLASDEGPVTSPRYPVPQTLAPVPYVSSFDSSAADRGLTEVQSRVLEQIALKKTGT